MAHRILFVDHAGVMGGAELSLLDIASHFGSPSRVVLFEDGLFHKRLDQRGIPVTLLANARSLKEVSRTGGIIQDLRAIPGLLKVAWRLGQIARNYDLLYANSQKSMLVGALVASILGKPFVWHLRDLMTDDHFSPIHRRLAVGVANAAASSVIANSHATKQAFVDSGGRESKITVIHNGISVRPFDDVNADRAHRIRSELGLSNVPIVGTFSRLAPWKGQHILIQALEAVPGLHALLVGDALFDSDRHYEEELRRRAIDHQVADRVHFLGFREDIPELMKACDIIAHTSVSAEPFGRVIVEGMLAQRPVIATRAGGACEIVSHGETGLLVEPAAPGALADALQWLVQNPDGAHMLARQGARRAEQQFALETMLGAIEAHLDQILQSSARSPSSHSASA